MRSNLYCPRVLTTQIRCLGLLLLGLVVGPIPSALALPSDFEPEVAHFEVADQTSPPPPAPIVFTGSSTITRWQSLVADFPDLPVMNRGFGGSRYSDIRAHYERVILRYRPSVVVLYSGDNDLAEGWAVSAVLGDFTNLVNRIRGDLPATRILAVSIKPSPARLRLIEQQRQFNEGARRFCATTTNVVFLDTFSAMLDQTGQPRIELFGPDRLHMNATGYALWRDLINAEFSRWGIKRRTSIRALPVIAGLVLAGLTGGLIWWRRQRTSKPTGA